MELEPIAKIISPLKGKFGTPRQSGLAPSLPARIVFEHPWRDPESLRGLEGFSHIWLIWGFSENRKTSHSGFQATVRPPRLGGNDSVGVFASRSPYRPNPLGLSCVRLKGIVSGPDGPELEVLGADLVDGTPIYDIKPYIRYADCRPDAVCGYVDRLEERHVDVRFAPEAAAALEDEEMMLLREVLENDPRPSYQDDPDREYGMTFRSKDVHFTVSGGVLIVTHITQLLEK